MSVRVLLDLSFPAGSITATLQLFFQVLRVLRFSDTFRHQMVLPLVALFFGTGNQTPNVASAVIARVFLDPDLRWVIS